MRKIYFFCACALLLFNFSYAEKQATLNLIKQEIQYVNEEATEVYFVWGINNWSKQDKRLWPAGTYEKGPLLSTPMKNKDGVFSVELYALPNTVIDYVFWITKGPKSIPCDIWDVNHAPQKDYHSAVYNDNITTVNSKVHVRPGRELTILDYSGWLLIIAIFILVSILLLKKYFYKELQIQPKPTGIILCVGFIALICHLLSRASVARIGWDLYFDPQKNIPKLMWLGYYDFLFLLGLTLFFLALNFVFRNYARLQKICMWTFIVISVFSMVVAILNIRIVETIGKPFNYRWLYYSGFLNSADSKAAVSSNISSEYIVSIIYFVLLSLIASVLLIFFFEFLVSKYNLRKAVIIFFFCANLGFALKAGSAVENSKVKYDLLANPITAFAASVNPFTEDPELFTMDIPDSLRFEKQIKKKSRLPEGISKIKNVLLVVLESTAAEYVQPWDSKYKATPTLENYLSSSIVFENIYAHAPATNKSMVCLLGSVYPWLSYTSETQEHPEVKLPTISSELQKNGFRTAFFNSADNNFQRAGEFLANRKFDMIKDLKTLNCLMHFEDKDHKSESLDGVDDECTADELNAWVKKDSKPFFGVIWTYQTHYPYFVSGQRKLFTESDSVFNRYLNAVHHSDQVLSKILENLKANNLFESTLVVVIGDHGEAFGRHNQFTHASAIYEENVHIPCIFINPAFKGERRNVTGGIVDIAPTVMDMLGQPAPEEWEGVSLFSKKYNDRTYFFCPWSDYLFGYKEGDTKYIFNATKNASELYNIKTDPYESTDLSSTDNLQAKQQKLAAWIQYQNRYTDKLFKK